MKRLLQCAMILAAAALLGFAARQWLFSTVSIAGTSMENTLLSGDIALIWQPVGTPDHSDVIECRFPGRTGSYIKRVVGLPGDSIEFSGGVLTRNGTPVSEPYVSSPTEDFSIVVPENEYFVLGDNRAESYDSRAEDMGCITGSDCLGRAVWILWPLDRFGPIE